MAHFRGRILDGEQILYAVEVDLEESALPGIVRPWKGTFHLPQGKELAVGQRFRLALGDGRSGFIAIRAARPNNRGATDYSFQGIGALNRNT